MAIIPSAFSWRRWSAKQWILAALLGALVAIAVVAGISISLAPGHISFSIASATTTNKTDKAATGDQQDLVHWYYNFTLVANNTSGRTSASYRHLKAEIWFGPTSWIPIDDVNTTAMLPEWQQPRNATSIAVGANLGQYSQASNATKEGGGSPGCPSPTALMTMMTMFGQHKLGKSHEEVMSNATNQGSLLDSRVVVEAKVRFRFGLATTVPYTIRVSCRPVNFINGTHFPVKCRG